MTVPDVGSRIATGISWAVAGGLAAWAAARVTAADRVRRIEAPVAPLLSFTPLAAAAGHALGVAGLRPRQARPLPPDEEQLLATLAGKGSFLPGPFFTTSPRVSNTSSGPPKSYTHSSILGV